MTETKTCGCGKVLARRNLSGFCRTCYPDSLRPGRPPKRREPRFCACGTQIYHRNTSGYCKPCSAARLNADPEINQRRLKGLRNTLTLRPELIESFTERLCQLNRTPEHRQRAREQCYRLQLWRIGQAAAGPAGSPARRRAAQTLSETKLAHIPRERRKEYRRLVRYGGFPAVQAAEIVLDQHARDMAAFTEGLGASLPQLPSQAAAERPAKPLGRPRKHFPRSCSCGEPIGYRNTSGWCKRCSPVQRAAQSGCAS